MQNRHGDHAGIPVNGTDNVVIHNSAINDATDHDVPAGNDADPVGKAATSTVPRGHSAFAFNSSSGGRRRHSSAKRTTTVNATATGRPSIRAGS